MLIPRDSASLHKSEVTREIHSKLLRRPGGVGFGSAAPSNNLGPNRMACRYQRRLPSGRSAWHRRTAVYFDWC